jgi:endonuclease/exonuclease/phosphatase family metal-dependent hydrolase
MANRDDPMIGKNFFLVLALLFVVRARGADLTFTVMAANLSGTDSTYAEPATRIFHGLKPEIVAIQEWNITDANPREFVDRNFGTGFHFYVESEYRDKIPNGIISRWPITASGKWVDRIVGNRDFVWATVDLPGLRDLHLVSVHFKSGETWFQKKGRQRQASALVEYVRRANWPATDYLVIAGDLNTTSRNEPALKILSALVSDRRQPADQNGDKDTNIPRNQEFDYVLPNPALEALHVPVVIGGVTFPEGMVFDSRAWSPPPLPIQPDDSSAEGMQHLCVMKSFRLPDEMPPP